MRNEGKYCKKKKTSIRKNIVNVYIIIINNKLANKAKIWEKKSLTYCHRQQENNITHTGVVFDNATRYRLAIMKNVKIKIEINYLKNKY